MRYTYEKPRYITRNYVSPAQRRYNRERRNGIIIWTLGLAAMAILFIGAAYADGLI